MGIVEHFSDLCSFPRFYKRQKRNQELETVEIRVKMDCEGCEKRVRKAVEGMEGVNTIDIDLKQHKLTVTGYVDRKRVLNRVRRKTRKPAEMWPYVPYDTVEHPYAAGTYDKRAPAGYVRNVGENTNMAALARASSTEVRYTNAFSDENANSCVVM